MTTTEEQLRILIDQEARRLEAQGPDHLKGDDWFQVSAAEQAVFGLDPETMAQVVVAFDAYLAIADIALNAFHDTALCQDARKAFPWIVKGQSDAEAFRRFAGLVGVSNRQAEAFYWKHAFWEVREGLVSFWDEPDDDTSA
jgi:hypothetical protein